MNTVSVPTRRALLVGAAATTLAAGAWMANARLQSTSRLPVLPEKNPDPTDHLPFGPIRPPRPLPATSLLMDDGSRPLLTSLLTRRWTWLQLMFTGCGTTCPIQGAIFQAAEARLQATGSNARLLSISIDPISDDVSALKRWLASFSAGPAWRAAAPDFDNVWAIAQVLNGRGRSVDVHDARAYLIDPTARLVYATAELPDPGVLVDILAEAQGARLGAI